MGERIGAGGGIHRGGRGISQGFWHSLQRDPKAHLRIQDSFPRGGGFFGRGVQIRMLVSTSSKGVGRGLGASEYREKCSMP